MKYETGRNENGIKNRRMKREGRRGERGRRRRGGGN